MSGATAVTRAGSEFLCGDETPRAMALLKGSDREIILFRVHFVLWFSDKVKTVISALDEAVWMWHAHARHCSYLGAAAAQAWPAATPSRRCTGTGGGGYSPREIGNRTEEKERDPISLVILQISHWIVC